MRLDRGALARRMMGLAVRTWDPSYDGDALASARFAIGRVAAAMSPSIDCVLSFERVPLSAVTVLDPARVSVADPYPILRDQLVAHPTYDSAPLVCARVGGRLSLWDGHHRLATYLDAARPDFPAWVARFSRGSGAVSVA